MRGGDTYRLAASEWTDLTQDGPKRKGVSGFHARPSIKPLNHLGGHGSLRSFPLLLLEAGL